MALDLCSNCRLPVNGVRARCPQCGVLPTSAAVIRGVPVAAAVALFATFAVLARRRAIA
ncbi:hypothetical protein BH23GEM6_BH23GEM6_22310 [soil metagenome]